MNRVEFMQQLERLLCDIPESDRLDAIAYYEDYFEEAGAENEAQVIRELGSPGRVAATIKADIESEERVQGQFTDNGYREKNMPSPKSTKKGIPFVLIIVLLVFASPILLGVGGGLFGGFVGVLAAIVGVIIAFVICAIVFSIGGIACLTVGVIRIMFSPLEGLLLLGTGGLILAVGLVLDVLVVWGVFKWLPALFRWFVNLVQKLFKRSERRSES